ncbi:hypothetical protein C8R43DRAFT_843757, partial [Mycena crocata]
IASSTVALTRYDIEIQKLQETLRGLLEDKASLKSYVDGCRAALSPVRRLPPEILCEVFALLCTASADTFSTAEELQNLAKMELLQLSRVCSHWHRLVMGTPGLWSEIVV